MKASGTSVWVLISGISMITSAAWADSKQMQCSPGEMLKSLPGGQRLCVSAEKSRSGSIQRDVSGQGLSCEGERCGTAANNSASSSGAKASKSSAYGSKGYKSLHEMWKSLKSKSGKQIQEGSAQDGEMPEGIIQGDYSAQTVYERPVGPVIENESAESMASKSSCKQVKVALGDDEKLRQWGLRRGAGSALTFNGVDVCKTGSTKSSERIRKGSGMIKRYRSVSATAVDRDKEYDNYDGIVSVTCDIEARVRKEITRSRGGSSRVEIDWVRERIEIPGEFDVPAGKYRQYLGQARRMLYRGGTSGRLEEGESHLACPMPERARGKNGRTLASDENVKVSGSRSPVLKSFVVSCCN